MWWGIRWGAGGAASCFVRSRSRPESVLALHLRAWGRRDATLREGVLAGSAHLSRNAPDARRAFTQMVLRPDLSGNRDAWAERLAPLFGHNLADHPPVVMKQFAAMRAYDATARLHELAGLPALVVGARYDPIARRTWCGHSLRAWLVRGWSSLEMRLTGSRFSAQREPTRFCMSSFPQENLDDRAARPLWREPVFPQNQDTRSNGRCA